MDIIFGVSKTKLLLDNNQMKKTFLILLLCLFSSSVNAGLKEIGSSYVSQETKDKINTQFEENKSKKKNKKFSFSHLKPILG